jgi:oligoendopeptidase F
MGFQLAQINIRFNNFYMNKMQLTITDNTINRKFLEADFELTNWESLNPFYENLLNKEINNTDDLHDFFVNRSELESYISENFAWRYIKMTCDTANKSVKTRYDQFVTDIQPHIAAFDDKLNTKILSSHYLDNLQGKGFEIAIKGMRKSTEIFRTENIALYTEIQHLSSEYQATIGAMSVEIDGKTLTLQQAGVFLENTDRAKRDEVFHKIQNRRLVDKDKLEVIFDKLLALRHKIAQNAGFNNFRDYSFAALKRFDYGPKECFDFHDAVAETVIPLLNQAAKAKREILAVDKLRPWDKAVDVFGRPSLHPFNGGADLLNKTIECFTKLDPFLGDCMQKMKDKGRLDLESRIGKAPGGYNYPLEETGFPFIFMNASSLMRDVITILHEGGHAVHSIVTKDLEINSFRNFPSEVAELASMSMELITMDHWDVFFDNAEDLKRAKIQHLEDIITTLPWVATIDKFQHWVYENPTHTQAQRQAEWVKIYTQFTDNVTDWEGLEQYKNWMWHRQLHVFELPFYYIEYGIAQLGAIGVWKNYKENPQKGLSGYLTALKLGYTQPIDKIYEMAGIKFDFSKENISNLMNFVKSELDLLHTEDK